MHVYSIFNSNYRKNNSNKKIKYIIEGLYFTSEGQNKQRKPYILISQVMPKTGPYRKERKKSANGEMP